MAGLERFISEARLLWQAACEHDLVLTGAESG